MVKLGWLYLSYFFAYLSIYFGSILIPSLPTVFGVIVKPYEPSMGWTYTANTTYTSVASTTWNGMNLLVISAIVIMAVIVIGVLVSGFTMRRAIE